MLFPEAAPARFPVEEAFSAPGPRVSRRVRARLTQQGIRGMRLAAFRFKKPSSPGKGAEVHYTSLPARLSSLFASPSANFYKKLFPSFLPFCGRRAAACCGCLPKMLIFSETDARASQSVSFSSPIGACNGGILPPRFGTPGYTTTSPLSMSILFFNFMKEIFMLLLDKIKQLNI